MKSIWLFILLTVVLPKIADASQCYLTYDTQHRLRTEVWQQAGFNLRPIHGFEKSRENRPSTRSEVEPGATFFYLGREATGLIAKSYQIEAILGKNQPVSGEPLRVGSQHSTLASLEAEVAKLNCRAYVSLFDRVANLREIIKDQLAKYQQGKINPQIGEYWLELELHHMLQLQGIGAMASWRRARDRYRTILANVKKMNSGNPNQILKDWHQVRQYIFQKKSMGINYCKEKASMIEALAESCTNCAGETALMLALFHDAGFKAPQGHRLGIQVYQDHVELVLLREHGGEKFDRISLITGVSSSHVAHIYPAYFSVLFFLRNPLLQPILNESEKASLSKAQFKPMIESANCHFFKPGQYPTQAYDLLWVRPCDRSSPGEPPDRVDNSDKAKHMEIKETDFLQQKIEDLEKKPESQLASKEKPSDKLKEIKDSLKDLTQAEIEQVKEQLDKLSEQMKQNAEGQSIEISKEMLEMAKDIEKLKEQMQKPEDAKAAAQKLEQMAKATEQKASQSTDQNLKKQLEKASDQLQSTAQDIKENSSAEKIKEVQEKLKAMENKLKSTGQAPDQKELQQLTKELQALAEKAAQREEIQSQKNAGDAKKIEESEKKNNPADRVQGQNQEVKLSDRLLDGAIGLREALKSVFERKTSKDQQKTALEGELQKKKAQSEKPTNKVEPKNTKDLEFGPRGESTLPWGWFNLKDLPDTQRHVVSTDTLHLFNPLMESALPEMMDSLNQAEQAALKQSLEQKKWTDQAVDFFSVKAYMRSQGQDVLFHREMGEVFADQAIMLPPWWSRNPEICKSTDVFLNLRSGLSVCLVNRFHLRIVDETGELLTAVKHKSSVDRLNYLFETFQQQSQPFVDQLQKYLSNENKDIVEIGQMAFTELGFKGLQPLRQMTQSFRLAQLFAMKFSSVNMAPMWNMPTSETLQSAVAEALVPKDFYPLVPTLVRIHNEIPKIAVDVLKGVDGMDANQRSVLNWLLPALDNLFLFSVNNLSGIPNHFLELRKGVRREQSFITNRGFANPVLWHVLTHPKFFFTVLDSKEEVRKLAELEVVEYRNQAVLPLGAIQLTTVKDIFGTSIDSKTLCRGKEGYVDVPGTVIVIECPKIENSSDKAQEKVETAEQKELKESQKPKVEKNENRDQREVINVEASTFAALLRSAALEDHTPTKILVHHMFTPTFAEFLKPILSQDSEGLSGETESQRYTTPMDTYLNWVQGRQVLVPKRNSAPEKMARYLRMNNVEAQTIGNLHALDFYLASPAVIRDPLEKGLSRTEIFKALEPLIYPIVDAETLNQPFFQLALVQVGDIETRKPGYSLEKETHLLQSIPNLNGYMKRGQGNMTFWYWPEEKGAIPGHLKNDSP